MTIRLPAHRPPTHSGEMLLEEFLKPMGISQRQLAAAIFVPYSRINKLINGEGRVTAGLAYRLSKFLGTTPRVLAERTTTLGSVARPAVRGGGAGTDSAAGAGRPAQPGGAGGAAGW